MDWQGIAAVLAVFVSALSAVLSFRQESFTKRQEYELKRREEEDKEKRKLLKIAANDIMRELHRLLIKTDAQRAYIVQPHPMCGDNESTPRMECWCSKYYLFGV